MKRGLLISFTLSLLLPALAGAAPFDTDTITWRQPDTTITFEGRYWGDEFQWWFRTSADYAVYPLVSGWYVYAVLDSTGEYAPSTDTVGIQAAPDTSYQLARSEARQAQIDSVRLASAQWYVSRYQSAMQSVSARQEPGGHNIFWKDTLKCALFFLEFTDMRHRGGFKVADYDSMLFGLNYFDTVTTDGTPDPLGRKAWGSMAKYYKDISGNKQIFKYAKILNPVVSDTVQWFVGDSTAAWWLGRAFGMINHVNGEFSRAFWREGFDTTGYDLVIVFSTLGAGGSAGDIVIFDSTHNYWNRLKAVDHGTSATSFPTIGVLTHELGHCIGFFDQYTDGGSWHGTSTQYFDLMGWGSYNGDPFGSAPAPPDPFHSIERGWATPTVLTTTFSGSVLSHTYPIPKLYISRQNPFDQFHWSSAGVGTYYTDEFPKGYGTYFVFENRQPSGPWTRFYKSRSATGTDTLRGGDLLIWGSTEDTTDLIYGGDGVFVVDANSPEWRRQSPGTNSFFPKYGLSRQSFSPATSPSTGGWPLTLNGIRKYGDLTIIDTVIVGNGLQLLSAQDITTTGFTARAYSYYPDSAAKVWIVYGTTNPPTTRVQVAASALGYVVHTYTISGLGYSTKCYYTFLSTVTVDTLYTAVDSVTTLPCSGGSIPSLSWYTTPISWTGTNGRNAYFRGYVNPNGSDTTRTWIKYDTSSTFTSPISDSIQSTPFKTRGVIQQNITGTTPELLAGRTYYFEIVGRNSCYTVYSPTINRKTTGVANDPPVVITDTTTNAKRDSVTLVAWFNANNASTTPSVRWCTTYPNWLDSATMTPNPITGTTFTKATVRKKLTLARYIYQAKGVNAGGTTYGDTASVTLVDTAVVPTATTLSATNVTASTIQFRGIVDPNRASTAVYFDYGLTKSYGSSAVAAQSPLTGDNPDTVSYQAYSLLPSTKYYYRVRATNEKGTALGLADSATTLVASPQAWLDSVVSTRTAATAYGRVYPGNATTYYWVEYDTVTGGSTWRTSSGSTSGLVNVAVTRGLSGLLANTWYYARLVDSNSVGKATSAERQFKTGDVAGKPPTVTTDSATSITTNSAILHTRVNSNGSMVDSVRFRWRSGFETIGYTDSVTFVPPVPDNWITFPVGWLVARLDADTRYFYDSRAHNFYGWTTGGEVTFVTLPTPTEEIVRYLIKR